MAAPVTVPTIWDTLVHHIALPPRLPGRQDSRLEELDEALTERLYDACCSLRKLPVERFSADWDCIRRILFTCKVVNAGGKLSKESLLTAFQELHGNDLLILHVVEQNAGILVRRYKQ